MQSPAPFDFDPKQMRAMGFVWEILVAIAVPIVLLALAGSWLDRRLDTTPAFTVASFPCALALSYHVVRRKAERLKQETYHDDQPTPPQV